VKVDPALFTKYTRPRGTARCSRGARSITDPDRRASALTAVAQALAQAGQHEQAAVVAAQAESVARSITHPDQQASALTAVAQALAQAGNTTRARSVAAAVSVTGRWSVCAGLLLLLEPSAVSTVSDLCSSDPGFRRPSMEVDHFRY
jgi:hypothetical protein